MKKNIFLILFISATLPIYSQDIEGLIKSGNQLFSVGDFEKAKEKYLASAKEKKDDASILYNLGNVEFKLKRYKESLQYYQDALKLKPNDYLTRNLLYHIGNAQQAIAHENMQEKAPDNKIWDDINKIFNSVEISASDKNQRVFLKKSIDDLKKKITDKNFDQAIKCINDLDDISKKANDKTIMEAVASSKKMLESNGDAASSKNLESQIEKVKQSIGKYEESFQSYRKSLEVSRKIAIKEGRDISEVGNYIKNNWAIARERWSLLYEELNRLMKENLKLKEGVADLIKIQDDLYNRLEQVYMNSQMQEILDYNLKVLAEFHTDYKEDILQLQKIADDDLNTKKTELENLKATQQKAKGQPSAPDQEKATYEKQEKEIATAEKIATGLRNVEGFENFIEDGLKRSDLFNARRAAFQMLTFLKCLDDYLNKTAPIDRTFNEMHAHFDEIFNMIKELSSKEEAKAEVKGTVGDIKFKSNKIIQEKLIDTEFLSEQLCTYLDDYIKEGSLKSKNESPQETPENKWLIETLNLFVKNVVSKLVDDLKKTQSESKDIRENLFKEPKFIEKFEVFKEKNDYQYSTYKSALLGLVEGVQVGVDQLESIPDTLEINKDYPNFYQLLNDKLQFFISEMEKEKAPEAFKNKLPFIKQKLQHFQENYPIIFDVTKDKDLRKSTINNVKDDLSKIIFFIDPMKTMAFKFGKLIQTDESIFKDQTNAEKCRGQAQKQIDELKSYFDILLNSINKQLNEAPKSEEANDEAKKAQRAKQEEMLVDWKKSLSLLNLYEKSLKSLEFSSTSSFELHSAFHKTFVPGLQQSAARLHGQPSQATETLKFAIGIQNIQKEMSKEIVEKRWKDQINQTSLDLLKAFQQENVEMVGVRGINQVLKMQEEDAKKPAQPAPASNQNATPEKKIDFASAIKFMKEAVNEGDKIISFYEVREFSNTPEIHDKKIEDLTKALEILDQKNAGDKNQEENQEKNEDENKEQQAQGAPKPQNGGNQDKQDKNKEERKPLELTAEQARQLLNELNKQDEGQKKAVQSKSAINTPRPW